MTFRNLDEPAPSPEERAALDRVAAAIEREAGRLRPDCETRLTLLAWARAVRR